MGIINFQNFWHLNMRSKQRGAAQHLYKLLQLLFCNLNLVYSFLDDKQPSNLCLNTSSNGELTTLQGFKRSLTFFFYSIPTPHTTFSNPTISFSVVCVGQELGQSFP